MPDVMFHGNESTGRKSGRCAWHSRREANGFLRPSIFRSCSPCSSTIYANRPEEEDKPRRLQPARVRVVAPSWLDRALSAWYEKTTDEPIVAIIRQDVPAQYGAISPDGQYIATGGTIIRDVAISSVAEKRIVQETCDQFRKCECRRLQPRRPIPGDGPWLHGTR